jgi:hypothetical protein
MKKYIFFIFLSCISCSKKENDPITQVKETYYFNGDDTVKLSINFQMIYVQFNKDDYSETNALNILKNFPEIDIANTHINSTIVLLKTGITEKDYLTLLTKLNSIESVGYATPSFLSGKTKMFLTNHFFIRYNMSESDFQSFLEQNLTKFSKEKDYAPGNLYSVNKISTGFESLDFANEINIKDGIEYSEPSFALISNNK